MQNDKTNLLDGTLLCVLYYIFYKYHPQMEIFMKKRLLSLLLAILMIASIIPVSVLPILAADSVAQGGKAGAEQS